MQEKTKPISFSQFLTYFPEVDLPVTLTEETSFTFSTENKPLPQAAILQYLEPFHKDGEDDMTEYVPCLRIAETHEFHAIIYWRARLMEYEYFLATYSKKGNPIAHRRIAGTFQDASQIIRWVATMDPDWIIYVVIGQADITDRHYNPLATKSFNLELLATGEIISS